ncbi:MAG: polysaccharide deacetylase family protein, partial [Pseudomonadota bacterium]
MKRVASLSLDLDNKWSYLQTLGDERWKEFATYLPTMVPRTLEFLSQRDIKITFFIVGRDASIAENEPYLRSISDHGHEIGCHSFKHEPWLHFYSREEIDAELNEAEESIISATGQRPKGFRGPGYSISSDLLRVLQDRGYEYDCTSFPNILNPIARAYIFKRSKLSDEEKERRGAIFGTSKEALRPLKPYFW